MTATPDPSATIPPVEETATPTPTDTATPPSTSTPTSTPTLPPTGSTYYVSLTGSDTNPGTAAAPFRTVRKGLVTLVAGDTLLIESGEYRETILSLQVNKGTPSKPVTVRSADCRPPTHRAVLRGLLWLTGADYWRLDCLGVTWDSANASNNHMLKMTGGVGWRITNSELWGARSFAALLVTGGADQFYVGSNTIHDTYAANAAGQDHLIYLNNAIGGVIERNLLYNSPNGRAIKAGSLSDKDSWPRNVRILYNTMYNNLGPSNIQFSYAANNNRACGNILQKPAPNEHTITAYRLSGSGNVAVGNVGWDAVGVVQPGFAGLVNGGGNLVIDPWFANLAAYDFTPTNPAAQSYGLYAPASTAATC